MKRQRPALDVARAPRALGELANRTTAEPGIGWFSAGYADHIEATFLSGNDC